MEKRNTLSYAERRSMSSSLSGREIHSPVRREESLYSVYRRETLSPLDITEGHSLLCLEKTLSPLYREGIVDAVCQHLYREEDTPFCVENTISPQYGEKELASPTSSNGTLSALYGKRAFSSLYNQGVCLVYTRHRGTLSSV